MSDLERELIDTSRAWMEAIATNDAAAIAAYMTDDWVLVTPQAGPVAREQFLAAIAEGHLVHHSMVSDGDERVQVYGDGAVLVSRVKNHGAYQGEAFTYDEWATDTYVRRDGGWRCVVTALTPVFESP